jgi:dTMP kinase
MSEIIFNERSRKIVRKLIFAFENKDGVFSDTKELLENQIPIGVIPKSREHANFLFYLISQDHGTKSAKLYERAKKLYSQNPDNFHPVKILENSVSPDSEKLISFLSEFGVRYPKNSAKYWFKNSEILKEKYNADARNLFISQDANEILQTIKKLHGFGPKLSGLLFRVFVGVGISKPTNIEQANFPTDIHDTRIAAYTNIADIPTNVTENTYSPFVKKAESIWKYACDIENLNWLQVDRALWILGSKGCVTNRHSDCPIKEFCIKGDEMNKRNSLFINFEGIDNSGKTTLIKDIKEIFEKEYSVYITRELTTDVGRLTLKKLKKNNISLYEKVLLFAADRVIRYEKDLKKIINDPCLIISDRWFYSALAYRSAEDESLKDYVVTVNRIFMKPDINFYIDITPEESARRGIINDKNNYTASLLGKVRNEYKKMIIEHKFVFIDGMKDYNIVKEEIISIIRSKITI